MNIAPYLTNSSELCQPLLNPQMLTNKHYSQYNYNNNYGYQVIYNSNYKPLFDNFYLSNPISRASVTMGKCSSQFL
jgi:hypothetical protein